MENSYGIGVKNRYELFYDEDVDPLEIIRLQEEEKEKRKTDKTQSKDKSKISKSVKQISTTAPKKPTKETPVTSITKSTESVDKTRIKPFDKAFKASRSIEDSKDVEDRKNFRNKEEQVIGSETREREFDSRRGGRGGFRGRGRPRGRGGFFSNFEGRPRRDFDRQSGSDKLGVRPVDKKDGGSNNWSDVKTEVSSRKEPDSWMDEEFEATPDKHESSWTDSNKNEIQTSNKEETLKEKTDDLTAENMDSKENEPVPEERIDSAKQMTLDEWKREQQAKRAVPKYNLRKPGEGEDGNQWKKLYLLKKKAKDNDDDEEEEEEDEEDVDDEEFARRGRQRQLVDIQINFNDSRRGRGRGRGVRGIGPRSAVLSAPKDIVRSERREDPPNVERRSYARGTSRSSKSGQQSAPRVDDWNDFPSLVTA